MRDTRATHNRLAVSATHREPGLNVEGIVDLGLLVDKADIIKTTRQGEVNTDEATGKEEGSYIYMKERKVEGTLNFKRLQPQHLALAAAYALGGCSSSVVEADKVYLHTITPITGDLEAVRSNPTLTGIQQLGSALIKTLLTSLMVDEFTLSAQKNAWPTLSAKVIGTGKIERNLLTENVAGLGNATTLNLTHKVEGGTAADRLAAVHQVRFKKTGEAYWRPVAVTVASGADPAVLTIRAPLGTADAGTYEVIYIPDEDTALLTGTATSNPTYSQSTGTSLVPDTAQTMIADEHIGRWLVFTSGAAVGRFFKITDNGVADFTVDGDLVGAGVVSTDAYQLRQFGWLPMPVRVAEPPLYVTDFKVIIGGEWDGAAFQGGRIMDYDLPSITWSIKNGISAILAPGSGDSQVASVALRKGREQTLEVSRQMKEAVFQLMADADFQTFGLQLEANGGLIPGSTGHHYLARITYPMVALRGADPKVEDERLAESLQFTILESDAYPSVIVQVQNAWPSYAQA